MADRGIGFSDSMVLALLGGHKTQTRRLAYTLRQKGAAAQKPSKVHVPGETEIAFPPPPDPDENHHWRLGTWHTLQPGDRLYVREGLKDDGSRLYYAADGTNVPRETIPEGFVISRGWCPPMHMPRWASRISLFVESVRIEAVQQISRNDAVAEGIVIAGDRHSTPTSRFASLWDSLHDRDGERWADDPYVVVIGFAVKKGNIDA